MPNSSSPKMIRGSRRRIPNRCRFSSIGVAVLGLFAGVSTVEALPVGEQIVAGQVNVSRPSTQQLQINQQSGSAIINWQAFSIGASERVGIQQPSVSSVLLNRVVGGDPSQILGQLTANGRVFLVNPSGVLFAPGSQVNTGSLIASTLDIDNADLLAGRYAFVARGTSGAVVNGGNLTAADGGTVALLGGSVTNSGTISARLGTVALGAGDRMTLDFQGDGLTQLHVDAPSVRASISNGGLIAADGGQVVVRAAAAADFVGAVINQGGTIRARSLTNREGRVVLDGGATGDVLVSGLIDASGLNPDERGGSVTLTGQNIALTDGAVVDARGAQAGGSVLVGGDVHGANPGAVPHAQAVWMADGASIDASAQRTGNGGSVVLWSDASTQVHGTLRAAGGAEGGDGGFIETSGPYLDLSGAKVFAGAPRGKPGEWLLDPLDVEIFRGSETGNDSVNVTSGPNFRPTDSPSRVDARVIEAALNTGTSVTVSTEPASPTVPGPSGPMPVPVENGDISVYTTIVKSAGGDASLTLNAHNDIYVASDGGVRSSAGRLNVNLNADSDGSGIGGVILSSGSSIATNGGNVAIYGRGDPAFGYTGGSLLGGNFVGVVLGGSIDASSASGTGGNISVRASVNESSAQTAAVIYDGSVSSLTGIASQGGILTTNGGSVTLNGVAQSQIYPSMGVSLGGAPVVVSFAADSPSLLAAPSVSGGTSIQAGSIQISGVSNNASLDGFSYGVAMFGATLSASSGGITIQGTDISQQSSPGNTAGTAISSSSISQPAGNLLIVGASSGSGHGLAVSDSSIGQSNSNATIVLGALNGGAVDALLLDGNTTIATSGVVNFQPRGTDVIPGGGAQTIRVNTAGGTGFDLSATELSFVQPGFSRLVIGSDFQTGAILLSNAWALPGGVTLQTAGPGSQGIQINAPVSGNSLSLVSGGTVTQMAPLTVANLMLHGTQPTSNFQLTDSGNRVNRVEMQFDTLKSTADPSFGDVTLLNNGALSIGPVAAAEMTGGGNGVNTPPTSQSVVAGDAFVRTTGNLTLEHSLSTLGSDITLVTDGVFSNPGGSTLTPGGGGFFQVWAQTWANENRGGLVGSQPYPNFYGCTFGVGCPAASAAVFNGSFPTYGPAPLAMGGSHFFYADRPTVTVVPGSSQINAVYGQSLDLGAITPQFQQPAPPADDNVSSALVGGYGSLGSRPNVGTYTVSGNFTSPVGYVVDAPRISVVVNPAVLAYVADPASRLYGAQNPVFSGTVTGFVDGENLSNATSGTLSFSSPAGSTTPVGQHPINGGGLEARNYTFVQAPGNATALTINPAILTYVADPASRLYGAANPLFGGRVTGFVNNDSLQNATTGSLVFTSSATATTPVGQYSILGSGLSAANYSFVQAASNATALTINPAVLTYVANPVSRTYGATNPSLTGSVTGFVNNESQSTATTGTLQFATEATSSSGVGQYAINGAGLSAANYRFVQAAGNATALTIDPAVLTYLANPATRGFGEPNPPFSGSISGFVNGDTLTTATSGSLSFTSPATPASPVGQYAINGGGLAARNYLFVQDPSNGRALTVAAARSTPLFEIQNRTREDTLIYSRNITGAGDSCLAADFVSRTTGLANEGDDLSQEWSRVRAQPRVAGCVSLDRNRNSCSDF